MRINPPHRYYGPFEIRENILEFVGDEVPPHTHSVPHMTYVIRGRVQIRLEHDGKVVEAEGTAGQAFYVPPEVLHSIVALEADRRADCVFTDRVIDDGDHC